MMLDINKQKNILSLSASNVLVTIRVVVIWIVIWTFDKFLFSHLSVQVINESFCTENQLNNFFEIIPVQLFSMIVRVFLFS